MFVQKVRAYIERWQMLPEGSSVLAGVSGGADSVCLLLLLKSLEKQLDLHIHVVHVHHCIRGAEADRDAEAVEEMCRQMSLSCTVVKEDVPALAQQWHMTLEEAARKVRYEAFFRCAEEKGISRIAVAHHLEDQEETILMNLFRGSGFAGAAGMKPVNGMIIRPLLEVNRQEIEAYVRSQGISWQTDATNEEICYTRNYMRRRLMPEIEEKFPQAGERLRNFAFLSGEVDRYLTEQAKQFLLEQGGIDKSAFLQEDPVLQTYILRTAMDSAAVPKKDVTSRHYEMLKELCGKPVGHRISLPGGWEAVSGYEKLEIGAKRQKEEPKEGFCLPNMEQRIFAYEKNMKFPESPYTKWFDYDKIGETAVLRTRQKGDRFSPLPHGSKKLKDYMIDAKIPKEERDGIPLAAAGQEILWIVGYRMSEAYKVTPRTKTVLEIRIEGTGS